MTEEVNLNPAKRDELLQHPRFKPKLLVLNIITVAFYGVVAIYFGLVLSGIIGANTEVSGESTWMIPAVLSEAMLPLMFFVGSILLKAVKEAGNFEESFQRGVVAVIVTLGLGEAATILGLISPFLGAQTSQACGIMVWGLVVMVVGCVWIRPRVVNLVLIRLEEEETP